MSFKDFIARNFSKSSDEGKTLISLGENKEEFSFGTYEKPDYENLEKAFRNYSVFSSLNLLSQSIFGGGFDLISDNKEALVLCEPIQELKSFKPRFVEAILNALVFGDGYNEVIWENKNVVGF